MKHHNDVDGGGGTAAASHLLALPMDNNSNVYGSDSSNGTDFLKVLSPLSLPTLETPTSTVEPAAPSTVSTRKKTSPKRRRTTIIQPCPHCEYKTSDRSNMRKHILAKHTEHDESQYIYCPQCTYRTISRDYLSKHMNSHQNRIKCEYCDFETRRKMLLVRHVTRVHSSLAETGEAATTGSTNTAASVSIDSMVSDEPQITELHAAAVVVLPEETVALLSGAAAPIDAGQQTGTEHMLLQQRPHDTQPDARDENLSATPTDLQHQTQQHEVAGQHVLLRRAPPISDHCDLCSKYVNCLEMHFLDEHPDQFGYRFQAQELRARYILDL